MPFVIKLNPYWFAQPIGSWKDRSDDLFGLGYFDIGLPTLLFFFNLNWEYKKFY